MKTKKKSFGYAKYGYLFCLPFVIAFLIFSLYPIIYTVVIGFTDLQGARPKDMHLVKNIFDNFVKVWNKPTFITSLKNTVQIWLTNFVPQMLLALLLTAWFTDRRSKIKAQGFFKVVFYMPNIITAATIAILFNAFFAYPMGPVNDLFVSLGLDKMEFLQNKLISQCIVAFIQFWMWYGYTMVILISGVLGISPEVFESAEIDGAGKWQTFFYVTIPNIKSILLFTLITSLIGGLNMFDIPHLFLSGGPDNATITTNVFIYKLAFDGKYLKNQAAAASVIMFIIIAIISAILFFSMRDKDEIRERKQIKAQIKARKAELKRKGAN